MTLRIAIVGGVAGGAGAAAAARRANESARIDIFEAGQHISFANCGLPYYLSGEIDSRDKLLLVSPETMKSRFNVDAHLRHEAISLDRVAKTLLIKNLTTGEIFNYEYDRLIIATGAKSIRPPFQGLDHPRLVECRTVEDADQLRQFVVARPKARALVIGGGFIGIEVAEAMTHQGMQVTLLDLASQVLPPFDPEIAAAAQEHMRGRGVTLKLGAKVESFEHGEHESYAILASGECVAFDLGILAIGVTPQTSLAKGSGIPIGATGGIVVNEYQQTSDPNIFAAGDVTELLFWPTQSCIKLALAGPANKQARAAGTNAATSQPQISISGAAGTSIVRVFDLAVAMTGLSEKIASLQKIAHKVIYTQNGHHAGYFPGAQPLFIKLIYSPDTGRVLGGQIFGAQGVDKRIDVLATAIQGRFTVDQLADLDLAYAPPFGAAKDPLVIAGMVASNEFHGRTRTITPQQLRDELASVIPPAVVDVRSAREYAAGRIVSAINIPLDELRASCERLPIDRPLVVHCEVGYRGYLAERALRQLGHANVRNLTGGYRAWKLMQLSIVTN